ncbi:MAG: substrate-binding domain-containing protein [Candidatus Lernaella stagnicola]|nr:substrate-binding domain-containing protein [Candidatus Lernaella stagnicola]
MLRQRFGKSMWPTILLATCCLALLFACQQQAPNAPTGPAADNAEPQGTIRVSGAWALYPMMVRWGEEYSKLYPKVRVDISAGGAGKGAADALAKMVNLGMVSRTIKPQETAQGGVYVPVAKDAVFPTVNSNNPAVAAGLLTRGIPRSVFVALFINGETRTWNQILGTEGGEPVQVYSRSDSCGAAETWATYLGGEGQEALQGVSVYGDPGLAEAVRRDIQGLGFNNLNFAYDTKTGLPMPGIVPVPIDINENGTVDPEEKLGTKKMAIAAVAAGHYPSPPARNLNLLTKEKFTGVTKHFVRWILTDGQQYLAEVGYIPVAPDQLKQALQMIEQ